MEAVLKISVVIPAFNEEKLIAETLRRVRTAMGVFAEKGCESELIVCDNNSTDHTGELARAAGALVVFEPVNQIGRARNTGAKAASGDWLIFVDADSHPSEELFAEVLAAIQTGKVLAGGCTVVLDTSHFLASRVAALWNCISRIGRYMAGSFIFCEAKAFHETGGFDERLYASEEIDLSKRLKRLARATGKKIVILHKHPLVTSARKMHLYSGREHGRFLLKILFNWRGTLGNRDACHTWYDGRR
jgi:glycosyltransferase involved in cell wall biosynthesis